jgi:hypothetical protein
VGFIATDIQRPGPDTPGDRLDAPVLLFQAPWKEADRGGKSLKELRLPAELLEAEFHQIWEKYRIDQSQASLMIPRLGDQGSNSTDNS